MLEHFMLRRAKNSDMNKMAIYTFIKTSSKFISDSQNKIPSKTLSKVNSSKSRNITPNIYDSNEQMLKLKYSA